MLDCKINNAIIYIETDCLEAQIHTEGYVSGVAAGTLLDRSTGTRDLGFGLGIADFLLEEGEDDPDASNAYHWGDDHHGNIPKRYVELPQICTKARKVPFEVIGSVEIPSANNQISMGVGIKQWYNWTIATRNRTPGSLWEQLLIFPEDTRYFFSIDRVTSANEVDNLSLRIDMPGHLKHNQGDSFSHIYLSYCGSILNNAFFKDFPPDAKYRYVRGHDPMPKRMIRAYQTKTGPWLAGMTLDPAIVSDAWCHQRGYVCFIQEVGPKRIEAGETFSAAYIIGFFDSIEEMKEIYDQYRGCSDVLASNLDTD